MDNEITKRYPEADHEREDRVVAEIKEFIHDKRNKNTENRIRQWIKFVMADVGSMRPWWFLDHVATKALVAGADVIDIAGHFDKLRSVFAPLLLKKVSLDRITELRQTAAANGLPNAGTPCVYALEAGRRLHFWPAPAEDFAFALRYVRPMHIALVQGDLWELIIFLGVISFYHVHFDRDALTSSPAAMKKEYKRLVRQAAVDHWDVVQIKSWRDDPQASSVASTNSTAGTAVSNIVPASLVGVGFETIDVGDYPVEVR